MLYSPPNERWEEHTANASKYPQGRFNPKPCRRCSATFTSKAPSNLYCLQECTDHAGTTASIRYWLRYLPVDSSEAKARLCTVQRRRLSDGESTAFRITSVLSRRSPRPRLQL